MHISRLKIENFRGVKALELVNLRQLVVVAGPNGIGKSTIFDAIRLLKSLYGGHQENEFHQWFAEFQVNFQTAGGLRRILRDPAIEMVIEADLHFSDSELAFVRDNASALAHLAAWQQALGANVVGRRTVEAIALEYPHLLLQIENASSTIRTDLEAEIDYGVHKLRIVASAEGIGRDASLLTSTVFGTYDPEHLGLIDYHGPQRTYAREQLGGFNLSPEQGSENLRNHALYNSQNKYANVKTELLSSYVRGLLSDRASGISHDNAGSRVGQLDETLKLLFRAFIPDKSYQGIQPTPDGSATFPVVLADGATHDIDDLSSGEKELLYGYLRIRNATPVSSILLLDEPELHLNPALARALPAFYFEHFVREMGDQVWFVTHSDALLREAFGSTEYTVIHMRSATEAVENQAVVVSDDTLESAVAGLVGDLATYRPSLKVVVLEGGGDTEFDANVLRRLFPRLESFVTLVSGGSKSRATETADLWSRVARSSGSSDRFWSITDRDDSSDRSGANSVVWDRYHIESYLLEPEYLRRAHRVITLNQDSLPTEAEIDRRLEEIAVTVQNQLVLSRMIGSIDGRVKRAVKLGGSVSISPGESLAPSLASSAERLSNLVAEFNSGEFIERLTQVVRVEIVQQIDTQGWKVVLPGREVLKAYVAQYATGVSYSSFINAVVYEMTRDEFRPDGMVQALREIEPRAVD